MRRPRHSRGRDAESPLTIPALGWRDILLRTWDRLLYDYTSVVAAGVAFYALVAMVPALAALISVTALFTTDTDILSAIEAITAGLAVNPTEILAEPVQNVIRADERGLGAAFAVLFGLFSATRGTMALIEGMNLAYEERERRSLVKLNLAALALSVFMFAGLLVSAGVAITSPLLAERLGKTALAETLLTLAPWPILTLVMAFGLAILYRFGPSRARAKWRWVTPGSAVATLLWLVGSVSFSAYVANFGRYNEVYGTLGGVVLLLTWLWLSAFAVLLGAELNAEMEHQTTRDSTTGPPKPMGKRGAYKADTVGRTP